MKIISLGWGIQSFTLAAMVALGELEPVDVAIHADTTHERTATYDFAQRWTPWLEERGVKVVTVQVNDAEFYTKPALNGLGTPPLFTSVIEEYKEPIIDDNDEVIEWLPTGYSRVRHGQMMRSCTQRWKIAPMRRWIQANRNGQPVEQWLGISLDEVQRMKPSDVKYITHRWPLIEKRMSRHDCTLWLTHNGLEIPSRSACVFCPFHSVSEWRDIRDNAPEDWQKAVEVDKHIRGARPPYDLFVNVQRVPLDESNLDNLTDKGQLSLWDNECEGICGI